MVHVCGAHGFENSLVPITCADLLDRSCILEFPLDLHKEVNDCIENGKMGHQTEDTHVVGV